MGRSFNFTEEEWEDVQPSEGLIEAITAAIGHELARIGGKPITRTTSIVSSTDTTIYVESTFGANDSGYAYLNDEPIQYTGRDSRSITGVTRETVNDPLDGIDKVIRCDDIPIGASVTFENKDFSLVRNAVNSTTILGATGQDLVDLGVDLEVLRTFPGITEDDYRHVIHSMYLKDCGVFNCIFRVLYWSLRWLGRSGTDGSATATPGELSVPSSSLPRRSTFHDRWINIEGSFCRIISAVEDGGNTILTLEQSDGAFFQASPVQPGDSGLSWELVPFRLFYKYGGENGGGGTNKNAGKASHFQVYIYDTGSDDPYTYMMGTSVKITDGRPKAGKILALTTDLGNNVWPLYFIDKYAKVMSEILRRIIPVGTAVTITAMPE